MEVYNDAAVKIEDSGGIDASTITSREDIRVRIKLIDAWAAANESLAERTADTGAIYRSKLVDAGVTLGNIDRFMVDFNRGARPGLQFRVRNADRLHAKMARSMLEILDKTYGAWRIDEQGFLVFDREEDGYAFDQYLMNLERIEQTRTLLIQGMIRDIEAMK